jgi:hypothetical protein
MIGEAELQSLLSDGLSKLADQVALGTHLHGVEWRDLTVPECEVVVLGKPPTKYPNRGRRNVSVSTELGETPRVFPGASM